MLFYTGKTRKAGDILSKQKSNSNMNKEALDKMREQAEQLFHELTGLQVPKLGEALKHGWELKKSLAKGISDPEIDKLYGKALAAGAVGGKITGAGGGGFLVLFVPPESHWSVRNSLGGLKELEFKLEPQGSKIIYVGDEY
jgi:D-glycero-alpha-D-manno-heptose-7-phosphate kinase